MSQKNNDLAALTDADLLDQFESMVKWWHYDPMGSEQPSRFDVDDLRAEVANRLARASKSE